MVIFLLYSLSLSHFIYLVDTHLSFRRYSGDSPWVWEPVFQFLLCLLYLYVEPGKNSSSVLGVCHAKRIRDNRPYLTCLPSVLRLKWSNLLMYFKELLKSDFNINTTGNHYSSTNHITTQHFEGDSRCGFQKNWEEGDNYLYDAT